ncbi:hypothetical protein GCM10028805_52080 [Spirosoma harenae]
MREILTEVTGFHAKGQTPSPTIMADLTEDQQKIKSLEDSLAVVTKERDTLKEQLTKAKSDSTGVSQQLATALEKNKELVSENTALKVAKEAAEKDVEQALTVNKDLKEQLTELASGSKKIPTIKVGAQTYEFLSEFFYRDQEITLDVLKNDTELAKEVVKQGISNLRLVTTKA